MSRLDEIKARAEAATEGPWVECSEYPADGLVSAPLAERYRREDEGQGWSSVYDQWQIIRTDSGYYPPNDADMAFIAHSREDIPWLIERVEQLEEVVQGVAEMDPCGMTEAGECGYCGQERDDWYDHIGEHESHCLYLKARKLRGVE